jgi:hypothetical protein
MVRHQGEIFGSRRCGNSSLHFVCMKRAKDPDAVCLLDPKQFPDFENRRVSWNSFCDEVEAKEMPKNSNVIGVVSQCKGKTLEAMQTFR